jgi:peptidoglycan hydrolase CwlO-like protein
MRTHSFTSTLILSVIVLTLGLTGCGNKELENEVMELRQKNADLNGDLAKRDQYIEDIVSSINNVYNELEIARAKEKQLLKETEMTEGATKLTSTEVRQQVLRRISDIGSVLKENRKRIANLQSRLRSSDTKFKSLDEMVESLKRNLEEREQTIAQLENNVRDLETRVDEKTREVAEKEKQMNTAYYVVGTRKELEDKGIIQKDGGFLWGLLGSTTILASGVEELYFRPIDKTITTFLPIDGRIDEIIPKRSGDFYQTENGADNSSVLRITDPKKFWQDKYLVIITG